jgi:hypothetical protein
MAENCLLISVPFVPRTMSGMSARAPIAAVRPVDTANWQAASTFGHSG